VILVLLARLGGSIERSRSRSEEDQSRVKQNQTSKIKAQLVSHLESRWLETLCTVASPSVLLCMGLALSGRIVTGTRSGRLVPKFSVVGIEV